MLCHCARWLRNSQDCTDGIIFAWNDDIWLLNLSCDGLLAVGIAILLLSLLDYSYSLYRLGLVVAITKFSLLTHIRMYIH